MKILAPTLRFVARASRRVASTLVSTFFSAVTAIRLEVQREINALPLIFDGAVSSDLVEAAQRAIRRRNNPKPNTSPPPTSTHDDGSGAKNWPDCEK